MVKIAAMPSSRLPSSARTRLAALHSDGRGAVLIETALSLPILVLFLMGILTYGGWMMAAHAVQQAANEGARAALAGLSDTERASIATQTVTRSLASATMVPPALVTTSTQTTDGYFTVTVSFNAPQSPMFTSSLVPLPRGPIQRVSVVKLSAG